MWKPISRDELWQIREKFTEHLKALVKVKKIQFSKLQGKTGIQEDIFLLLKSCKVILIFKFPTS